MSELNFVSNGFLFNTRDGISVYMHADSHLDHDMSMNDVKQAGSCIIMGNATIGRMLELDMRHQVGFDALVETSEHDNIVMFRRGNRNGESRMAPKKEAEPTSYINVVVGIPPKEYGGDGRCYLYTAYAGRSGEREPWDASLDAEGKAKAESFWANHALVPTEEQRSEMKALGLI